MLRTASGVFVPPDVARDQIEQTEEFRELALKIARRYEGIMRYWTDRLRFELDDDRLELIFWPPDAPVEQGLEPGRYHVMRRNDDPAPPTFIPVEGEKGEFVEPGEWLIAKLRESDLQNPQLVRAMKARKRTLELSREREQERDVEERREHIRDLWNAHLRTSVSFNRDTAWTQNAAGKKAA